MERYKIGFALPSLHDHGGVNKAVMHLTDALREMGHEVHLFPFGAGQKKIDEYHHPINTDNAKKQYIEFDHCYKRVIEQGPFNLFVANTLPSHLVCTSREVDNLICCFHQPGLLHRTSFKIKRWILIKRLRKTYNNRSIVWVGKNVGDGFIEQYGIKPSSYKIIPNGLNIAKITKLATKKAPIRMISPFIISVGRLSREKNFPLLINAFKSFADKYHLVILGEGKRKKELEHLVNELSLTDKVHFINWTDNPFAWIKQASLCVSTSNQEACPMNVLEALILGTPMVSTDNLGAQEIFTGELKKYLTPCDMLQPLINNMKLAINDYPQINKSFFTKYNSKNVAREYLKLIKVL